MHMKICTKCHKRLPATTQYFYAAKNTKSGLNGACKKCMGIQNKISRQNHSGTTYNKITGRIHSRRERKKHRNQSLNQVKLYRLHKKVKRCSTCHKKYLYTTNINEFFYENKNTRDWLGAECKTCAKSRYRNYRKQHPKKIREIDRIQRLKHKNKRRLYRKTPRSKYSAYKSDKRTYVQFNLSFEEFMLFWQKPCWYCGDEIETIGLDRVDNSKGYVLDNILPCCFLCNHAKYTDTLDNYIERCKKVAQKHKGHIQC